MESIIALLIIFVSGVLLNVGVNKYKEYKTKTSFLYSLKNANIPIITIDNAGCPLNLLVDTGASKNILDVGALTKVFSIKTDKKDTIVTGNGEISGDVYNIEFYLNDGALVSGEFTVLETLSESFKEASKRLGIQVHGILGIPFLVNCNCIIDFNKLTIWRK